MVTEAAKNAFLLLRENIAKVFSLLTVKSVNSSLIKDALKRQMVSLNANYSLLLDSFAKESLLSRNSSR